MIYFLMGLLALIWGLSFLAMKILLGMLLPLEILAARWMIAVVTFILLIALKVIKVDYKGKPIKYLFQAVIYQPCSYAIHDILGVDMTTTSESSIFIAVIPLFVVLEGAIFLRQKLSKKVIFAICLSFVGVIICVAFAPGFQTGSQLAGYMVLIGAVVTAATYILISNRLAKFFSPMELTFALTIAGAIFFNGISLATGNGIHPYSVLFSSPKVALVLLFLGVGCSNVAYIIFNYALSKLPPAISSCIQTNSVTVVGVLAGILVTGDSWGLYTVIGLTLTLAGICMVSLMGHSSDSTEEQCQTALS